MHQVVVIGAGFAGIGMAVALKRAGRHDFVVLERSDDIGGTWRDDTYPGRACDIPSHLYSYSFEPYPAWSRTFATRAEIAGYLRHCADKYEVKPHVHFGADVVSAVHDEPSATWTVTTADGATYRARSVVMAVGALRDPAYPAVEGLESFAGPAFHSSRWDHSVDLTGKRVAVIGTGASVIQFVPRIAAVAGQVDVYQRTPPWIAPKPDRRITRAERWLYRRFPFVQRLRRALGLSRPRLMWPAATVARLHLRRQVADPDLRARLTPGRTIGRKRILLSNDYYPALTRSDVDLVTSPVVEVTPTAVRTADGRVRETDVIVHGTGFRVDRAPLAVTGFPNLFRLIGPNTAVERQIRFVTQALDALDDAAAIEVRPDVRRVSNEDLRTRLRRAVWSIGGCDSWYRPRD